MKKSILLFGVAALAFGACNNNDKTYELNGDEKVVDVKAISGSVQKGPFINGTSVRVSELNSDLQQTGKSFETQVSDNLGAFEFGNIGLISQYVELQANGYYYNEVTGDVSESQLTLRALTDLNSGTTPNINVLTTLERGRVEYLTSHGTAFANAKQQAQAEVLAIFNIDAPAVGSSEGLSIVGNAEGDAVLLAVSAILQGRQSEGALSQLIADISSDIRTDGKLDDAKLGAKLKGNAMALNADEVRGYVAERYKELGSEAAVPDFGGIVRNFVANTEFELMSNLNYPARGEFGKNLLAINDTACMYGEYSMAVKVPSGTELDIKVSSSEDYAWEFELLPGVNYSTWNKADNSRHFKYSGPSTVDIHFALNKVDRSSIYDKIEKRVIKEFVNNRVKFEVFENGALTMVKEFTILQEETCTEDFTKDENYPMPPVPAE